MKVTAERHRCAAREMPRHSLVGIASGLAAFVISSLAVAATPDLEPFKSQCQKEILAKQCAPLQNCYQLWAPIMRCAFIRAYGDRVNPRVLDRCIHQVDAERQQQDLCTACRDDEIVPSILFCLSE